MASGHEQIRDVKQRCRFLYSPRYRTFEQLK